MISIYWLIPTFILGFYFVWILIAFAFFWRWFLGLFLGKDWFL